MATMGDEQASTQRLVPAASRTVAILRLLSRAPRPMNLSEIAATLEIVPSTCLHILRVLVARSLVNVDPAASATGSASASCRWRAAFSPGSARRLLRTELESVANDSS